MAGRLLRLKIRRTRHEPIGHELAPHQITVNVYSPGVVHTPCGKALTPR